MPLAIKAFGVNTASATIYTCPSGRVAKVLINGLNLTSPSSRLNLGVVSLGGTEAFYNAGNITTATFQSGPLEYYLAAGQTINVTGGVVTAQIGVIEEAAS